jgi:hypothetical protein
MRPWLLSIKEKKTLIKVIGKKQTLLPKKSVNFLLYMYYWYAKAKIDKFTEFSSDHMKTDVDYFLFPKCTLYNDTTVAYSIQRLSENYIHLYSNFHFLEDLNIILMENVPI